MRMRAFELFASAWQTGSRQQQLILRKATQKSISCPYHSLLTTSLIAMVIAHTHCRLARFFILSRAEREMLEEGVDVAVIRAYELHAYS